METDLCQELTSLLRERDHFELTGPYALLNTIGSQLYFGMCHWEGHTTKHMAVTIHWGLVL